MHLPVRNCPWYIYTYHGTQRGPSHSQEPAAQCGTQMEANLKKDGSARGYMTGWTYYEKRVGDWNTVYEAEIEAIKEAIRRCPKSGACILMDSMSAFKALEKAIRCGEVEDCNMRRVMVAAEDKLKAHIGIRGNEIADVAAKGGSKRDLVGDE